MERKSELILLRVTKEEKEILKREAKKKKKTLSRYLVQKGLDETETAASLPLSEKIEIFDFLNEVYRKVQKSSDENMKTDIQMFCQQSINRLQEGNSESRINGKIYQ